MSSLVMWSCSISTSGEKKQNRNLVEFLLVCCVLQVSDACVVRVCVCLFVCPLVYMCMCVFVCISCARGEQVSDLEMEILKIIHPF